MDLETLKIMEKLAGHELTDEERAEILGTNTTQNNPQTPEINLDEDWDDDVKSRIKNLTANQMESIGVVSLLDGKADEIICPLCGNGSKHSKTGLKADYFNDGYQYYCFACNKSFDNIALFAAYFNLDAKNDFTEILRRADELTKNISVVKPSNNTSKPQKEYTDAEIAEFKAAMEYGRKHLDDIPTDDRRGLALETYRHFNWGYNPQTRRVLIPLSKEFYKAVLIKSARNADNIKWKALTYGHSLSFNFDAIATDAINIIVEGEIDALSIWQATGGKANVAALGGTNNAEKFIERVENKFPADVRKNLSFLVMLDNDDAGIEAGKKLVDGLINIGCPAVADVLVISSEKIDANDFLISQGDAALKSLIETKLQDAKIKIDELRKKLSANDTPKSKKPTTREVMPDCPIDLNVPNGFLFTQNGLYDKNFICNNPVVITKKLRDVENGEFYTEIAYYDRYYRQWHTKHYLDNIISDYRTIGRLTKDGLSFTQESAKALSRYFVALPYESDNLHKIPHNLLYKRMGWTDDTFTNYIYPDHLKNGDVLDDPKLMYHDKFKSKGNFTKWRQAIKKHFTNPQTSAAFRIIFGAALAAPLYRILGLRNAQYLLWCSTGSGKSATVKIAMSIYGNPEALKNTFDGTVHSIKSLPLYFRDLIIWMDEFQSASKAVKDDMQSIVYGFTESKSRSRLSRDGSNNPTFQFHGIRFFTAEQPILPEYTDAGAFNRVLCISTDKLFPPNTNIAEVHRFFNRNYGFFGPIWIDFIKDHIEEITNQFTINQNFFELKARQGNWTNAYVDHMAANLTALQFAMALIDPDENKLTFDDVKNHFMSDFDTIDKEIPRNASVTNQKRAKNMLEDYINSHPRFFKREVQFGTVRRMVQSKDGNAYDLKGYQFLDGSFGFIPTELTKILQDELGFSSATAILRGWQEEGLLKPPNSGRTYTRRQRIIDSANTQKNIALICFNENALSADVSVNLPENAEDYPSTF